MSKVLEILEALDEGVAERFGRQEGGMPASRTATLPSLLTARISNGYYTLTLGDGSHRTFRIWTKTLTSSYFAGERVIGMLIGPDNTDDYEMFGFVRDEGISVWKRFANTKQAVYAGILWTLATGGTEEGCELVVSKRCLCCNRELTTPESIERNIGPTCWEKIHG